MRCEDARQRLAGAGTTDGAELLGHVVDCVDCRALWTGAALLDPAPARPGARRGDTCPPAERLAALALGDVDALGRETLLGHAAGCAVCLAELAELLRDVDLLEGVDPVDPPPEALRRALEAGMPQARHGARRRGLAAMAAAAGLVLALTGAGMWILQRGPRIPEPGPRPVLRAPATDTPRPVAPRGEVTDAEGLRFSWQGQTDGVRYRLIVIDLDSGRTVVERVVEATAYALTAEEAGRLERGVRYDWLVEPVSGASREPSEPAAFRLAP